MIALALLLFLAGCEDGSPASPTGTASPAPAGQASRTPLSASPTTATVGARRTPTLTPSPAPPQPTLDVDSSDLQGLTVTFWHPWTEDAGTAIQSMVDEFDRTNRWGINTEVVALGGFSRLEEAVEAALRQQTLPDLLVGYNYQALHWNLSGNALVDLNPYQADPVWGFSADEQTDFYPLFWSQDLLPGRAGRNQPDVLRLGIPLHRSAYVLYYNESWGQELGYVSLPDTPFGLQARACAAAQANLEDGDSANDGTGGWMVTFQPSVLTGWIFAFGGELTSPGGGGYQFNTPQAAQALEYLTGLQEAGCAWVPGEASPMAEFAARRALFYVGSLADLTSQQAAFDAISSQDEWTVIPFPAQSGEPVIVAYGPSLLVSRSTPETQLAAWLLAKWLVEPQNQARWLETGSYLPTRLSTLDYLDQTPAEIPQWAAAMELLPHARLEPGYVSWAVMRWALSDALAELFSPGFTADQIPELLEALDQAAEEIFAQAR